MKNYTKEIVFINNTVAPYRIPLFNKIKKTLDQENIAMKVVFLCEKESVRKWTIDYDSIDFEYEILPCIFQKRDHNTTTSDIIINSGFMKYVFSDKIVLFGYNYPTYLIIMSLRKLLSKETILFSESTLSDKQRNKGLKHKLKSILIKSFFTSCIVPGLEAKRFVESYGIPSEKISIAENAIAPFSLVETKIRKKDTLNILYVGRLAKEKNLEFILNNIHQNDRFNYRLIIVGSGPEEETLRSINVGVPIEFKGFQEGEELAKTFFECDLFILPSNSEPWGLVINEAINAGLAIMVSDKVGCRHELVTNNGRIFELNNKADFQQKLTYISENIKELKANSLKISEVITLENQAHKMCKAVLNA